MKRASFSMILMALLLCISANSAYAQSKCSSFLVNRVRNFDLNQIILNVAVKHFKNENPPACNDADICAAQKKMPQMEDSYDEYPQILRPESLKKIFAQWIKEKLAPDLLPDKDCRVTDLIIVNNFRLPHFAQDPSILTVNVVLNVQKSFAPSVPDIAILTLSYYMTGRPDLQNEEESFAIPLNLSEKDIENFLMLSSDKWRVVTSDRVVRN